MKRTRLILLTLGVLSVLFLTPRQPKYFLNLSQSMPRGVYQVSSPENVSVGDVVMIELPEELKALSETRNWLSPTAPLLKRVGALEGTKVCVLKDTYYLNGTNLGSLVLTDASGFSIPHFEGCNTVPPNHFVALGQNPSRSFDSRYFGDLPLELVKAKAKLIYSF